MSLARTLVTIKRGGVYHPPGTILRDFSTSEIAGLAGVVIAVDDAGVVEAPIDPLAPVVPVDGEGGETSDADQDGAGSEGSRVEAIKAAIDLLDPEADFVKTGDRVGKPKLAPLTDVLGFKPEDAEIEAALAISAEQL
jgi:hypothetical protein